jgi:hypothetical protein
LQFRAEEASARSKKHRLESADGWSLDDKRQPRLPDDKLGPTPAATLTKAEADKNDLPDLVRRWDERTGAERARLPHGTGFCIPKTDIAAAGYDLTLNRYKEVGSRTHPGRNPFRLASYRGGDRGGDEAARIAEPAFQQMLIDAGIEPTLDSSAE